MVRKATGEAVEFDNTTEWQQFAEEISDGQWQGFALRMLSLNRRDVEPGFTLSAYDTITS